MLSRSGALKGLVGILALLVALFVFSQLLHHQDKAMQSLSLGDAQ